MRSMEIDRRTFLGLVGAGLLAHWPARGADVVPADAHEPLYLAARLRDGRYEAALVDIGGADRLVVPMPGRGHSFAIDKARKRAVVFGRQPGFFAVAFSLDGAQSPQALPAAPGRHFFGHGVYTPDGALLIATENDFESGRGVLGVYDASAGGGYRRVAEYDSGGIGPHEVVLLRDGRTLCVANGGILTHPDYGKLELNLDTMQPSLAYIDVRTGELLEHVQLPPALHRLSIRHMTLDAAGTVWFGCQYTGPAGDMPALVGRHRRGREPELFAGPQDVLRGMRNYVGSVAADAFGAVIATSSPVGGQVAYWDAASGRCLGTTAMFDGCGVAPHPRGGFLINSGRGELGVAGPGMPLQPVLPASAQLAWDNHFRKV